jgi:hypothetical protein
MKSADGVIRAAYDACDVCYRERKGYHQEGDDMVCNNCGRHFPSTSIESAGVTLVKGDLRGIVRARRLSRATMRNIRQNLFLAFVYNAVGVPVAAGLLYPLTGTLISPIWASAAMTFSSVSVIGNALRLRRAQL